MIINCPDCSTGYLLPEHLVGPGGARVRCPRCQRLFAVGADGRPRDWPAEPAPAPAAPMLETVEEPAAAESHAEAPDAPREAESAGGALEIARAVLGQLAEQGGEPLERAHVERRLFAEYGPALMTAYEAYRRRAGAGADPAAFREALRERWGVELVPLRVRDT